MSGIERIKNCFAQGKVFCAYLTAGDGGKEQTFKAAMALIKGGVNMLEIGLPFSDPIADGPVIQRAANRALRSDTTLQDVLWIATKIREQSDIPLILYSYLNPLLKTLTPAFIETIKQAGIDGILMVDCPLEESAQLHAQYIDQQLAPIYIITPATSVARIRRISQQAAGFIYYACRKGTTGVRAGLPSDFAEKMQIINANVTLPVLVGFGIAEQCVAQEVLKHAAGVVVGSFFVKALEDGASVEELTQYALTINPLCYVRSA